MTPQEFTNEVRTLIDEGKLGGIGMLDTNTGIEGSIAKPNGDRSEFTLNTRTNELTINGTAHANITEWLNH